MTDEDKNIVRYSNFLIRLAWTVEIIAVLIGFTISVLMAVTAAGTSSNDPNNHLSNAIPAIIISALPFLLVAVVELCKIPLVFTFMHSKSYIWKGLFLFFVLFLCLITFETMLNGFERNFSNLNKAIDIRKNKIINIETQMALIEKRKSYTQTFTEDDLINELKDREKVSKNIMNAKIKKINLAKNRQIKSISSDFEIELEQKIDRLINTRDEYYKDWSAEKVTVEDRFSSTVTGNISGSKEERNRLLKDLDELKAEMKKEVDDANFFTREAIKKKYRRLINDKEEQLTTITTGYLGGDAIEKQSLMENQLRQQIEFINAKYQNRVKEIEGRIANLKSEIEEKNSKNTELRKSIIRFANNQKNNAYKVHNEEKQKIALYETEKYQELEQINQKVFKYDEEIFLLNNQVRVINSEINHLINQNQVYRLATYVAGEKNAKDLNKKLVGIVAVVWFGSLALIAAVTGVMLALASFYLRKSISGNYNHDSDKSKTEPVSVPAIYDDKDRNL